MLRHSCVFDEVIKHRVYHDCPGQYWLYQSSLAIASPAMRADKSLFRICKKNFHVINQACLTPLSLLVLPHAPLNFLPLSIFLTAKNYLFVSLFYVILYSCLIFFALSSSVACMVLFGTFVTFESGCPVFSLHLLAPCLKFHLGLNFLWLTFATSCHIM